MKNKLKRYEYTKKWKQNHKEEVKEYNRVYAKKHIAEREEYRKIHKIELKIQNKEYRRTHKQEQEEYYLKNRKQLLQQFKDYRDEHRVEIKELNKKYYLKNKKLLLQKHKKYMNNRRKNDINFRLLCSLRHRLNMVLRGKNKSISTLKLLGCHIDLLKFYLQSKFQPGMSFDNYGKWHIDHIIPCARFDLSKVSEQKKCFNYTNLQPLWKKENLSKRSKIQK
jgi:hypothetical protein